MDKTKEEKSSFESTSLSKTEKLAKDNSSTSSDTVSPNVSTQNNNYSIYDYFKETPSVFLASVTAVIAVISFLINTIISVQSSLTASYWNISNFDIPLSTTAYYSISLAIIVFFISTISSVWIDATYSAYFSKMRLLYLDKYRLDTYFNNQKEHSKKNSPLSDEDKQKNLKLLVYKENTKTYICYAIIKLVCKLLISLIILSFIYTAIISWTIDYSKPTAITKQIILVVAVVGLAFIGLPCLSFNPFTYKNKLNKQVKFEFDNNLLNDEIDKLIQTDSFPKKRAVSGNIRQHFSNDIIQNILSQFVITTIIFCSIQISIYSSNAKALSAFPIVTENEKIYAIVLKSLDTYVLEEVTISDDEITIDLSKQRIVKADDISYEIKQFNKVYRLETSKTIIPDSTVPDVSEPMSETTSASSTQIETTSSATAEESGIQDKTSENITGQDEEIP